MIYMIRFMIGCMLGLLGSVNMTHSQSFVQKKPNIIYILAYDLGYGRVGAYGQDKIETPNIDTLAQSGMKFTQHYTGAPICSPARYVLMTGKHTGHAYIRGNKEIGDYDYKAMFKHPQQKGKEAIPASDTTVTELLKEGGIIVPMIASWPDTIEAGRKTDHISAFWDIMPTLSDIAGIDPPENIDGNSFLPLLQGHTEKQHQHDHLYWEYSAGTGSGMQAVRLGKWKGIRENINDGRMEVKLYDLNSDIQEQNNVADKYLGIVKKVELIIKREHETPTLDDFKLKVIDK